MSSALLVDPILFCRLLDKYYSTHPDFYYISNNSDINHRQYIDNKR